MTAKARCVAEGVDLNRVVDDQVDVDQRVDRRSGRRPISSIASRIAARSTTAGTPVKSCISTRAGWNGISTLGSAVASQVAIASTSAAVDRGAVLEPQDVLEQDLERVGQPSDVEALLQGVEPVDLELAATRLQGRLRSEAVLRAHNLSLFPAPPPARSRGVSQGRFATSCFFAFLPPDLHLGVLHGVAGRGRRS